jgi:hypothetical protein
MRRVRDTRTGDYRLNNDCIIIILYETPFSVTGY